MKQILAMLLLLSTLNAQETALENRGKILASDGKPIALSPLGGYVSKENPTKGKKGLQRYYDETLSNGNDVQTSIHRTLQEKTEAILDKAKAELNATEVLAMVMDSKSGAMLTMASSNRYDPLHIRQMDVPSLNPKFADYPYEPGSVMMPFTVARAIHVDRKYDKKWINTDYEKFQIGKNVWIKDNIRQAAQRPVDVLVNSSSIGISKIAFDIPGVVFHDALTRYGFGVKSGIDLPRDLKGVIKTEALLEKKLYRANTSYGYGMMATPIQLLKAYSMFSNNGWMVTPHIGMNKNDEKKEVLTKPAARRMRNMLIEVVQRGTGQNAKTQGLTVGGKTGTAHIAKNGRYVREYHSSFYGFAEDEAGHSYTIGVLVIEPKAKEMYFASRSAVPVFKQIVGAMVEQKLLVPKLNNTFKKEAHNENETLNLMHQRLHTITGKKKVATYNGEKTISPIIGAKVIKPFGEYSDSQYGIKIFNESITFQPDKTSSKVYNVFSGKVVFVGKSKKLGKVVVIAHQNKLHTVYAGLSKLAPTVKVGQKLGRAYVIGKVKEKLIFQTIQNGHIVDPMEVIGKRETQSSQKTIAPLAWSKILQPYGADTDKKTGKKVFRESLTLVSTNKNAKVYNVLDGKVLYVGENDKIGKSIIMEHEDGLYTVYGNLSILSSKVKKDKILKKGFELGNVERILIFQTNVSENNSTKTTSFNPMNYIDYKAFHGVYVKQCDVNGDGITAYRKSDVTHGFISKEEALVELKCQRKVVVKELKSRAH